MDSEIFELLAIGQALTVLGGGFDEVQRIADDHFQPVTSMRQPEMLLSDLYNRRIQFHSDNIALKSATSERFNSVTGYFRELFQEEVDK